MKNKTMVRCPYCGSKAVLRPAAAVYGENAVDPHTYVYVCGRYPICDAYVYAHHSNKKPMGSLANGYLRKKRIQAHNAMEAFRQSKNMTRSEAYLWIAIKMGLPTHQVHFGSFGIQKCDTVIRLCRDAMQEIKTAG